MINDYGNDANGRKDVSRVNETLTNLYEQRDNLLKKIELMKFVRRHIELTENYTTTILKHMKRNDVVDFVKVVLEPDCAEIAASHPAFVQALFNGLVYHSIDELWFDFFNTFSMSMFEISELQELLGSLTDENNYSPKSFSDYKFADALMNHVLDQLNYGKDFNNALIH